MTTAHTATPKFSTGPIIKSDDTTRMCIYESGLGTVALVNIADDTRSDTYDQDKADDIAKAEFIVRACNAHDDLVKALQEANHFLKFAHTETEPHMQRISAALAKAGN